jgi:uncharacterized protein YodC (DUF2158 family)
LYKGYEELSFNNFKPDAPFSGGNMDFQIGDLVELKSGGPTMTVRAIADGLVYCNYFLDGDLKQVGIPAGALQKR